jgi:hypothetical protein
MLLLRRRNGDCGRCSHLSVPAEAAAAAAATVRPARSSALEDGCDANRRVSQRLLEGLSGRGKRQLRAARRRDLGQRSTDEPEAITRTSHSPSCCGHAVCRSKVTAQLPLMVPAVEGAARVDRGLLTAGATRAAPSPAGVPGRSAIARGRLGAARRLSPRPPADGTRDHQPPPAPPRTTMRIDDNTWRWRAREEPSRSPMRFSRRRSRPTFRTPCRSRSHCSPGA